MIPDFTIVVGVDKKHLVQFSWTFATWKKNKPSLLDHTMVVFYDGKDGINDELIRLCIDHPDMLIIDWNLYCAHSYGNGTDKWSNPQRYKMLAGFVHVPPLIVKTPYWLKLDTDAVAFSDDDWIDPEWFESDPAIICHPWGFTKPPNQMLGLDEWVQRNMILTKLRQHEPLKLIPEPGSDRVRHKRIGSWCGFFRTDFTSDCSEWARETCGRGLLPAPSQDGYLWYCAKRLNEGIVRPNMKGRGWQIWSTMQNIERSVQEALSNG